MAGTLEHWGFADEAASRRPKSRVGKGRSRQTQHPSDRYEYVLSELQALLRGSPEERAPAGALVADGCVLGPSAPAVAAAGQPEVTGRVQ